MAQNKIKWSKNAEIDLFETLQFYTHRNGNPTYSETILKNVTDITNHLIANPLLGRPHEIFIRHKIRKNCENRD